MVNSLFWQTVHHQTSKTGRIYCTHYVDYNYKLGKTQEGGGGKKGSLGKAITALREKT